MTDIGVLLPTRGVVLKNPKRPDADVVLGMAQAAEEAGLDSVWVGDSLLAKPRLEPVTTLAAVAACTQRVRIGTAVLLAGLRQPVTLAHALATVDIISGGRLTVAVGVGGTFDAGQVSEWRAVGVSPRERAGRLEEMVEVMRALWTRNEVSFSGRHFQLDKVTLEPKPLQAGGIPVLLACHYRTGKERQYQRAARLGDGFISISDSPEEFAQVRQKVQECARECGRPPEAMRAVYYMTVNINDDASVAKREGLAFVTQYYGRDFWGDRWGPYSTPNAVASRMKEYVAAGADTLIVRFASLDPMAQLQRFVGKVLPQVKDARPRFKGETA